MQDSGSRGVVALRNLALSSMPLHWRVFSTLYLGNCHLPPWLEANESVSHRSGDQPSAAIWRGRAWDRCPEVVEAKRGPKKARLWGKMILPSCSCSEKFPGTFCSGKVRPRVTLYRKQIIHGSSSGLLVAARQTTRCLHENTACTYKCVQGHRPSLS